MNQQQLVLFKLTHRGEKWIGIKNFKPLNSWNKVKGLAFSKYSKTQACWYIPYSNQAFKEFKDLEIPFNTTKEIGTIGKLSPNDDPTDIEVKSSNSTVPAVRKKNKDVDIIGSSANRVIQIRWTNKSFYIKLRYTKKDVSFLKTLSTAYWDHKMMQWIVASTLKNTNEIQSHFGVWNKEEYEKILTLVSIKGDLKTITFFTSPEYQEKFLVKIEGYAASVARVKKVPDRKYDKFFKTWILPWSTKTIEQLKINYKEMDYIVVDRLPKSQKNYEAAYRTHKVKLEYLYKKYPEHIRVKVKKFSLLLVRQRYSWKTITSYCGKLAKYIDFYKHVDIDELTDVDVNDYLGYISKMEVSDSLINLTLSSLKLYYEKVAYHEKFYIERLERPRRRKTLPTILSVREVDSILKTMKNLKHLTLLYVIYGGGLRLSEVINLRVQDVLWDRNQVHIKSGKGNKDRMVMLSSSLKELLRQYFDHYKPQYWLFEGKDKKNQYSSSSIQKMVRQASVKAGITRKVTPHTLRHCFATHLMDNGTDTRYIQELLGHKDIRTTLIYTHVTTSSIKTIESPLDQMKRVGYKVKKRNE